MGRNTDSEVLVQTHWIWHHGRWARHLELVDSCRQTSFSLWARCSLIYKVCVSSYFVFPIMDPHICTFRRNKSTSRAEIQSDKRREKGHQYILEVNYFHDLLHLSVLTEASWRGPGTWGFLNTQRKGAIWRSLSRRHTPNMIHTNREGISSVAVPPAPDVLLAYSECSRAPSIQACICIPRHRHCKRLHCGSCRCGCSWDPSGQADRLKITSSTERWIGVSRSTPNSTFLHLPTFFHVLSSYH